MCGIIAIVPRRSSRRPVDTAAVSAEVGAIADELDALDVSPDAVAALLTAGERLAGADRELRGLVGVRALIGDRTVATSLTAQLDRVDSTLDAFDASAAAADLAASGDTDAVRRWDDVHAAVTRLRDAAWAIRRDRLPIAAAVERVAGASAPPSALAGYLAIEQAFAGIDRMEVRGRDSAGVHVYVWGHGLTPTDPVIAAALADRANDPLFQDRSVRFVPVDGGFVASLVYKAAAEIGELGDNTAAMRAAVADDDLLRLLLTAPDAKVSVLGHTRWASVGIISEANAHPVNSDEIVENGAAVASAYAVGVLNGDVDNHADLKASQQLRVAGPITTDAKVIPTLFGRHLAAGVDLVEAFRRTVADFDGSVAIGAIAAGHPDRLLLALRGSGQGVYVGLADDRIVVASEPYGIVEETDRFVRLDGEHGGQVLAVTAGESGLDGLTRIDYDGTVVPIDADDVRTAEVTTRDIDLGDAPHFLLKEITEAPQSFAKTLRGKIVERDGVLHADVGAALPGDIAARLAAGTINKVRVIGQGTAAVAGSAMAPLVTELSGGELAADAITATELSGFGLQLDMSDTLAVAVSQSGTTTDTNRTVDLLKARGAAVLAIVNRRSSDLTDKADGVLYTSDGRDVEMSVASTKAFYSQVAAGVLLSCAIAAAAGCPTERRRHELLASLRTVPDALREVLGRRASIAAAAHQLAPPRRYWAVVGNGVNKVAAEEVRIKLSELCYKSISCDVTEDKKHIDLSAEPLVFVCAAGLAGSTADDVSKEVAIFRAHKATPIVVADDGEQRYSAAATIAVPPVDPALGFVLSTMAGHLFGYEAAIAIDRSALPLREAREVVERAVTAASDAESALSAIRAEIGRHVAAFHAGVREHRYDGHLEASTAVRVVGVLRNVLDDNPIEQHQLETGKIGSPAALISDLVAALTAAIDELTRPIDAIKHQAKTVTVGISRSDEGIVDRPLVQAALAAGAGRDVLAYRTLKVLADLDAAVADVVGFTRYAIDDRTISVVDRGGIGRELTSRVERNPQLSGTKHNVARNREVLVARGRGDGRTVIFVPEVKAGTTTGITLLHVRFHEQLAAATMRTVLQGYDRRYERLVDWVTETEGEFDESRLADVAVVDLLVEPISEMADRWRSAS